MKPSEISYPCLVTCNGEYPIPFGKVCRNLADIGQVYLDQAVTGYREWDWKARPGKEWTVLAIRNQSGSWTDYENLEALAVEAIEDNKVHAMTAEDIHAMTAEDIIEEREACGGDPMGDFARALQRLQEPSAND